jgi:hypothetical protein
MIAALLIAAPVFTAVLLAASLRLPSLVSTLLAAYLFFVANLGLVTWVLTPVRAVDRGGLAAAEGVLLAAASAAWWLRRRPGLPVAAAVPAARHVLTDPVAAVFLVVVGALLAYELVLVLTAPADNWDSLTYHLSRVVAWIQHEGIYRIPHAQTPRMNEYQPLAEQQILYLFVATGRGALFALPQYLAQAAILLAIYGASRRLGFSPRPAAYASFLFAMFSLAALQATTSQNDLVAASFPAVALCLLLGSGRVLEPALAGAAVGIGLGAKLTMALVLPVLLVLAVGRGRRVTVPGLAGAAVGFAAVGVWGYVLNLANTGHVLGYLGTHIDTPVDMQPLHPSSFATTVDVVYGTLDVSVFSDHVIRWLWIGGIVAGAAGASYAYARGRRWSALLIGTAIALPFLSPLLMIHAGDGIASLARGWGFPVRGRGGNVGGVVRDAQNAVFGPVGATVFLGTPFVTLAAVARRRADWRHLVLAAAVPLFYILLGHEIYNYFMTRFLLVPAALVAPLFALFLSRTAVAAAFLAVAAAAVVMVVIQDPLRPLANRHGFGLPWQLTQVQAAYLTDEKGVGPAVASYTRRVPAHACVGAVLGGDEPAYFLAGPRLEHRIVYLPVADAVLEAYHHLLSYVVISTGPDRWSAREFRKNGWTIRSLGGYWLLASAPHAADGSCTH